MEKGIKRKKFDGSDLKIGIVVSRWNDEITSILKKRSLKALLDSGVLKENIFIAEVPGSFELPLATKQLIEKKQADAVICLGCLIKGQTTHFDNIARAVSNGIMKVGLETGVSAIFGVLTCLDEEQARVRASKDGQDLGYEWGLSAVEMGVLRKS